MVQPVRGVQRVACGSIEGAGRRNGPNWPQLFGPKMGSERRSKHQKATGGTRKEGQLLGANIKACLGRGGLDLMGSNLYEDAKCSKAQKQIQKQGETGSLKCGSVISTGQKDIMHSERETRREDEGDRPGVKGLHPRTLWMILPGSARGATCWLNMKREQG